MGINTHYLKPGVGHTPSCCRENMCIGPNDLDLMRRLAAGGPVHAKYRRYIVVYVDITAPIYWWIEFDTYRTGVTPNPMDIEMNSTSTMHKIHAKEFTLEDFSHDRLGEDSLSVLQFTIDHLNKARDVYLETKDKDHWWQMIQLLPNSYHYRRTVMTNYEVLAHIYKSRKNHKLDEWAEHDNIDTKTLKRFYDGDFKLRDQKISPILVSATGSRRCRIRRLLLASVMRPTIPRL